MSDPKTIVRPDDDGAPDDIVVENVSCFRLERMSKRSWWAACYRGNDRITFSIRATKRGRIDVTIIEDDLGAVDDTHPREELEERIVQEVARMKLHREGYSLVKNGEFIRVTPDTSAVHSAIGKDDAALWATVAVVD